MKGYNKYVVPGSEGLLVRYPRSKTPLSPSGGWVPWTGPEGRYWKRRLKCGDVRLASPPEKKVEKIIKKRGSK